MRIPRDGAGKAGREAQVGKGGGEAGAGIWAGESRAGWIREDGEKIGHPAAGENVERGPEGRRKPSTQSGDLVLSPPHRLPRPRTS